MNGASPSLSFHAEGPRQGRARLRHLRERLADLSVLRLARQATFLAVILIAWITFKPFPNLSRLDLGDLVTGQEGLTYATFGGLALLALGLAARDHRRALLTCLTPAFVALMAWLCLSVLLSIDPATSLKRLSLTGAVILVTACLPLLAQTRAELTNLLAAACLILLGLCYVGMIVAPELSIHQRNDLVEPALAGSWRGAFGHKNVAAAVVAMILFIGIAVLRSGLRIAGGIIVVLSVVFLIGSEGKSAIGLTLAVLGISALFALVRSLSLRAVLALGPVLLLNIFTVGTVMNDGLAAILAMFPVDTTFTGRAGLWKFALEAAAERLIVGHGFAAFWGTQSVRDLAADAAWESNWAGTAAHSHNGYLDTVLALGWVGLALTLLVLVIAPLRDYQRASAQGGRSVPLATMFLQIWMFGLMLSATESFFYDRADAIWVTFLFAVFGLHYLARFRTR